MSTSTLHLFEGIGIELEYMIVARDTLDVRPLSDEILKEVTGTYSAEYEKEDICWSNELVLHVIELKTCGPVSSLSETLPLFAKDVRQINEILAPHGAVLLPGGTHPWMDPFSEMHIWPHHNNIIYETYNKIFDCRGHGWANLQSAHINLPFCGDDEFGRLHAAIRLLLPIMPALSASTPIIESTIQPWRDFRMEAYRMNSKRIPSITGHVIPEPIYTEDEYRRKVFARMYRDIAPHDPSGILQDEWLNARGAIARFDRSAIEIRVLDVQECPLADLAIAALIIAATRHFTDPGRNAAIKSWDDKDLAAILSKTILDAEEAAINNNRYLKAFGIEGTKTVRAGDIWRHLLETELDWSPSAPFKKALDTILDQGSLASRILHALNGDLSRPALEKVYRKLSGCLSEGVLFTG